MENIQNYSVHQLYKERAKTAAKIAEIVSSIKMPCWKLKKDTLKVEFNSLDMDKKIIVSNLVKRMINIDKEIKRYFSMFNPLDDTNTY